MATNNGKMHLSGKQKYEKRFMYPSLKVSQPHQFSQPAGSLEGEVTMPWRVASEKNAFAVNGY